MDNAVLLSPTDINVIRRYVHTKYAPLPGDRRAEIVADAIRRTLQQRLPNLPQDVKNRLTDELISRCLVGEQRDINPEDVLDLCAELNFDKSNRTDHLMETILDWVNQRSSGRWSTEQLAARLERRKAYPLAVVQMPFLRDEGIDKGISLGRLLFSFRKHLRRWKLPFPVWALLAIVIISGIGVTLYMDKPQSVIQPMDKPASPFIVPAVPELKLDTGMPEKLKYKTIDAAAVKKYLKSRDSVLAEDPYFGAIINSAREFDVHPLLLFAITGQEQGFVPKSSKNAKQIANNPFNVGHSWMEYNTSIHKSASIAAAFLAEMGVDRPEGHDPFVWFNKKYAEDQLWSVGVKKIFDQLLSLPPSS
jgi:hypothetical protein